ncbi:MAG: MFS transporter [Pseudomonadota bacterium]|nr:MFS transporter [Pseudomonadota bacterium]
MNSTYFGFLSENRRFLAYGFLMALCSSYGQTFFISVFGGEIRAEFGLTHGTFGLIYSIATLVSGFCMIWAGSQIDRFDLRTFSTAICIGLVASSVLTGWTSSVLMLGVAIFTLRLSGQGLMSHTSLTAMARYFEQDRGKAISIANLGFPTGQALFPVVGVWLTAAIGWRETWFTLALILAVILTPLLFWLLKGHGERHRIMLLRTTGRGAERDYPTQKQWSTGRVRRDPRFWLMAPGVLGLSFIGTGIIFHQVHLVEFKGWSLAWFAANYISMAASSVVTALLFGPLVDRTSAARLMPYYQVPAVLSLVLLASGTGSWIVPVFMVLYGVSVGMSRVVVGSLWAEWYGVRHLGAIRALVAAMMVMASAASPVLFGGMIDGGVTIDAILFMSTGYTVISIILILCAGRITVRHD